MQGTPLDVDATDPAMLVQQQLRRVNFLDLDIRFVSSHGSTAFEFRIYRKPGNAYAYLPHGSYHARHVFRGWLKAEMQRLLTHSSCQSVWLEECCIFYEHLVRQASTNTGCFLVHSTLATLAILTQFKSQ